MSEPTNGWHLDRRVPLALIITMTAQLAGIIWWGAQTSARLDYVERQSQSPERLARIEAKMESMIDQIARLERKLDRQALIDRRDSSSTIVPAPGR